MTSYALDDLYSLLGQIADPPDDVPDKSPVVRYLCAMFSELPYYHVPQFELDDAKRVQLIPCEAYRTIAVPGGPGATLDQVLSRADIGKGFFVVVSRGVVAVGVNIGQFLFIGFRGTQFLFDWRINLRARLAHSGNSWRGLHPEGVHGGFHAGFLEETLRVIPQVNDAIKALDIRNLRRAYLCGHSLGGAVAAIGEKLLEIGPSSVCMFGAPRYCDVAALFERYSRPPTQVRRHGDMVPTVPPRWFGFVDHLTEVDPAGAAFIQRRPPAIVFNGLWQWLRFLGRWFAPHSVEAYRREVGRAAGAPHYEMLLGPYNRLTPEEVRVA
jgi:pimeloyl-ACP methyl ester carboxylesterase